MLDLNRYDYVVKAFDSLKLEDATFWYSHLNIVTKSLLKMVNYYFLILIEDNKSINLYILDRKGDSLYIFKYFERN